MASLLEQLEQEIADRLEGDPLFANVEVGVDPQKNIVADVEQKIGRLRFLAVPLVASAGVKNPNEPGPVFENIAPSVTIFENPTFKLSAAWANNPITARELSERIHALLHLWQPMTISTPLYSAAANAIEQLPDKTLNIYINNFQCLGALTYQQPQLATPTGQVTAGSVTLACATAGAALFYTTDGTKPSPRNGTFYAAPFAPGAGAKVKARAWLAGYFASAVLTVQL